MICNALVPIRQRLNNLFGRFNALVVRFDDAMRRICLLEQDASRIGRLETNVRRLFGKYNSLRDDFEARSNLEAGGMGREKVVYPCFGACGTDIKFLVMLILT